MLVVKTKSTKFTATAFSTAKQLSKQTYWLNKPIPRPVRIIWANTLSPLQFYFTSSSERIPQWILWFPQRMLPFTLILFYSWKRWNNFKIFPLLHACPTASPTQRSGTDAVEGPSACGIKPISRSPWSPQSDDLLHGFRTSIQAGDRSKFGVSDFANKYDHMQMYGSRGTRATSRRNPEHMDYASKHDNEYNKYRCNCYLLQIVHCCYLI